MAPTLKGKFKKKPDHISSKRIEDFFVKSLQSSAQRPETSTPLNASQLQLNFKQSSLDLDLCTPKRRKSSLQISILESLNKSVKNNKDSAKLKSFFKDFEAENEELELLAKNNLGELCTFPSEDECSESQSVHSSQTNITDQKTSLFHLRVKEMAQSQQINEMLDRDVLNIKIDYWGLKNLCKSKKVYVVNNDQVLASMMNARLTNLELLFMLNPIIEMRVQLLSLFMQDCSNKKRFNCCFEKIIAILHFILQLKRSETNQTEEEQLNNAFSFCSFFQPNKTRLCKVSEKYLKYNESTQNDKENLAFYGVHGKHRAELCIQNIETFCSIILFLDFDSWSSNEICALLYELCLVYLDEITICIRPKLFSTIEILIDFINEKKKKRVIKKLLVRLINIDEDLRGILIIFSMLTRCLFFAEHCIHFLRTIFEKIINSNVEANSQSPDSCLLIKSLEDNNLERAESRTTQHNLNDSTTTGILFLFSLIPNVIQALVNKPTDQYIAMQLLDLCITDKMISNGNQETLLQMNDFLKISRAYTKNGNRLDEIVLDSMSNVGHRIGIVIHKRRAIAYKTADAINYSLFVDTSDDDEPNKKGLEKIGK